MNRRDFLKLLGIATGTAALTAVGAAPAEAAEAPITPQDPLAQFEIGGASYGVKSFNLEIVSSFASEPQQSLTVELFGHPHNNVFSALHGMRVVPFSLFVMHDGNRYEFAGKMILAGVNCLCVSADEYEAEITGKVQGTGISVCTKTR